MPITDNTSLLAAHSSSATTYAGPLGPRPRLSFKSACAKRSQSKPFTGLTKIPKRAAAHTAPQPDDHDDFFQPWRSDEDGQPENHSSSAASRRQRAREQQDLLWKERQPEHRFRRYCYLAREEQRRQVFVDHLQEIFASCLALSSPHCQHCNSAEYFQPVLPGAPILFANITGHVTVNTPVFQCRCGCNVSVHPISIGCFPATQSRQEVWYDNQLLALTAAAQHAGSLAIQAHCSALKELYKCNSLDSGRPALLDSLGMAAQQWNRVEVCIQGYQLTLHTNAASHIYYVAHCS